MNKETILQRQIMIALSESGHKVWRNETGRFWTGNPVHRDGQTVTLTGAAMIPAGLCVGSSDLIGIQSGTGRIFAMEVKTKNGRTTKEQESFIETINDAGGIAGVVRSVEDAINLLK